VNEAIPLEFSCTCRLGDEGLHLELFPTGAVMLVLKLALACKKGLDARVLPRDKL